MTHTLFGQVRSLTEPAVMVVVVAAQGSTPRKAGARMLVLADGSSYGTVGGGWIENHAVAIAAAILEGREEERLHRFELTGKANTTPMICGGSAELLFQLIPAAADGEMDQAMR